MSKGTASAEGGQLIVDERENEWTDVARKHWSSTGKSRKVKNEVVKNEIWDVLENEGFPFRSLFILENLQLLERFV